MSAGVDEFDTVEDRLVELDSRTPWQVGTLCKYLNNEDIENLKSGKLTDEEILEMVAKRKKNKEVSGVKLRGYRILSDKSQADCIEVKCLANTLLISPISGGL